MTNVKDHGDRPVALKVAGLRKTVHSGFRRRSREILRGVDLEVREGDVFGLLGPNGAGKTTTVKVVLGFMRPTAGTVEFLLFCARLFAIEAHERRRRVDGLLSDVGLEAAGGTQLRKYSKGMLQRIGIAQALVNDPKLVLLDEPMTGLDPLGRVEVKHIIEALRRRGKTVLFNSHILADVAELCSRIAIMDRGQVVWQGAVQDALADADGDLEAFFVRTVGK